MHTTTRNEWSSFQGMGQTMNDSVVMDDEN